MKAHLFYLATSALLSTTLLFLYTPSLAQESLTSETLKLETPKRSPLQLSSYKLGAGIRGTYFEDESNVDALSAFIFKAQGDSQLTPTLRMDAQVFGLFEQGTAQGIKQQSTRKDSGFYLSQARVVYEPTPWLDVSAGSLSQKDHMSPLIARGSSYPALRQNLEFKNQTWTYGFSAQQALPTSQKLSSKAVEKEPQPSYFSTAFALTKTYPFGTQARFIPGFYQFNNLPSAVATESCRIGNSVLGACASGTRFAHSFLGADIYGDVVFNLPREWQITPSVNYLQNFEAPVGQAQGVRYALDFFKGLNSELSLGWGVEYFEKQSDVTPAYYAPFLYENNRRGYGAQVDFAFSRRQIHLKAEFLQTVPLNNTAFQNSTINSAKISLETSYESL